MIPHGFGTAVTTVCAVVLWVVVEYRRGKRSPYRSLTVAGLALVGLGYGLLQISRGGPVSTGTPFNYALDGLAVLGLVVGLYALYRRRRIRNDDEGGTTSW